MMKRSGNVTVSKGGSKMLAFSERKYGNLLAKTLPAVITNDKEYARLEGIFNDLIDKGEDNLSPEESRLFVLLAGLLENYEARTLPPLKGIKPEEALRFLVTTNQLRQSDLEDIFGTQSAVSRALKGTRRITIDQAKGLARRFKVSAELFI